MTTRRAQETLTDATSAALVAMIGQRAMIRTTGAAVTDSGAHIPMKVMMALYDRYLVAIRIEGGARRFKYAILTEIGEHAARSIQRAAALTDDFENSPQVYADDIEPEMAPL